MPDMFNFTDEMNNYFNSMPKSIQESIMQSGAKVNSVADMQAIVQQIQAKSDEKA